jgi:FMN phosphatase YigB (HAD superfamily)
MPNWIFDLDYTLYQQNCSRFNYNDLCHCIKLNKNIKKLQGKKILFTNGNLIHTLRCIKIMKLEGIFHKVLCREITGFKPDINAYIKLYHQANINIKEPCIFFEDTIDNLVQSKRFNWTTVLIGDFNEDIKKRYPQIDYIFENINSALDFFLTPK